MENIEVILEQSGIPFMAALACFLIGIRLIVTGDPGMIRGKDARPINDEKGYARQGGILVIVLGFASALMGILLLINEYVAVMEMVTAMLILGIAWRNMNGKFGA